MDDPLTFPERSRSNLDETIQRLVTEAQGVLAAQSRLRNLLRATRIVADELELSVVLERIVEAAVELVGARYGALGVIGPDGSLEQFIHVGLAPELVAQIGHLPRGRGVLGALIDEQAPIRLEHLSDDPRSIGFPDGHPPMDSFLGVPVRVRNETFGNLYLTEHADGPFSEEDQELLVALAATAGAAIDHARLYDETKRRQRWAEASAEITAALLSEHTEDSLDLLIERVSTLADADLVCIVTPVDESTLRVDRARGEFAMDAVGREFPRMGSASGRALEAGQPVLAESTAFIDPRLGMTIAVPLVPTGDVTGVLTASRTPQRPSFTESDLGMIADFAGQASVAIRLVDAREDRERLALVDERARIARDLHDTVIQRLFGAGLGLQAIAGSTDAPTAARIVEQIATLDAAIADIRTAIFAITSSPASAPTLRHRILDLFTELSTVVQEAPRLAFAGPVDLMVESDLADDLVAVVREGLTNVGRHAAATTTSVSITVDAGEVVVEIVDDGVGVPAEPVRSSGTANLAARALARGGTFDLVPQSPRGTRLAWRVPIEGA